MKYWRHKMTTTVAMTGILLLGFTMGCSDATSFDDDGHAEPDGLVIRQGSTVLVEITEQSVSGMLTVQNGLETAHLTVEFTDHDGDVITVDESEFYLEVTVADSTVADFHQDTPGEFGGHFEGLAVGSTTMTFSLMHGQVDTGHPDYISPAVTGTVLN